MKRNSQIAQIPLWSLSSRIISDFLFRLPFPTNTRDKYDSLSKVINFAKSGKGLVIVYTHFSYRDAMEVNRSIIYKYPFLRNREAVNPLAYYQQNPFLKFVGWLYTGNLIPIVNSSTLKRKGFEHLPKGKGLSDFIASSARVLSKGGAVTVAINASRKEKLDLNDPQKPVGYLIASLLAKNVQNFGILLVSFAVSGTSNYSKKEVGGMNFRKTYTINIGKYFPLKELLNHPDIKGKISSLDSFLRKEFTEIVPKEYL
jgi:hypothetical protein